MLAIFLSQVYHFRARRFCFNSLIKVWADKPWHFDFGLQEDCILKTASFFKSSGKTKERGFIMDVCKRKRSGKWLIAVLAVAVVAIMVPTIVFA